MHLLVPLLTQIIMGRIERASNRMTHKVWWRFPIYFIIVASALWVAIASVFLWTSEAHPGIVGLLDFVRHGGPVWLLSIPVVAMLVVSIGSLPVAGRYGPLFFLQGALFWLTLLGAANLQGDGHSALNMAAVSSWLITLPVTLLVVLTALADTPPVTSPLAIFSVSYIGRVRHLRRLLASAQRFGWEVSGPEGSARAYTVSGYYGGRRNVRVVSGLTGYYGGAAPDQGYWYKVTVTSPSPLPTFAIARKRISPYVSSHAVTGTIGGGLIPLRFYVVPRYGQRPREEWAQRFAQQVAAGKGFMRHVRDSVQLTPGGILYSSFRMMRLPAKSGEIEPLVDWLIGIASLLEEIAPTVEQVAPQPSDDFTPKLPYGQISNVDPTSQTW